MCSVSGKSILAKNRVNDRFQVGCFHINTLLLFYNLRNR